VTEPLATIDPAIFNIPPEKVNPAGKLDPPPLAHPVQVRVWAGIVKVILMTVPLIVIGTVIGVAGKATV
jgi:hypothetical protein